MDDYITQSTSVFQPDPELVNAVLHQAQRGRILPSIEITVRDLHTGEAHTLLVDSPNTNAWEMVTSISSILSGTETDPLEVFFWLYWRGWAGVFPANVLPSLPIRPIIGQKLQMGIPVRGDDLTALLNALSWVFANLEHDFGDSEEWGAGQTLSAPHRKKRKVLMEFVENRMIAFCGEHYKDADQE